ncbi:hypothetical protein [Catenuloplanes atrovinosus]|uniref:Lipoprotein n=1 Tax=Catenuloplanes atrovinosus TaxID=137266 RepID=A0AAE3YJJ4_9ACTN|nr:hypothetical protein [Catenuloplanes atrovinosus]MDR7275018.1 hypothetical protein [Catenuloplanes atrovinosus]
MSRGHLAAMAALLLALAGCGGPSAAPEPAASSAAAPPDPKAALLASVAALDELNYEFTHGSPYHGDLSGVVHAPTGVLELQHRVKYSDTDIYDVRYRRVGEAHWLRIDLSQYAGLTGEPPAALTGKVWLPARAVSTRDEFGPLVFARPEQGLTGVERLVTGVVTVTRKGVATFEGTLDVTGAEPGTLGFGLEAEHVKALGERARSLTFRATTDNRGRLRQFGIELPAAGDYGSGGMTFTFDQYGTARAPAAPTGDDLGTGDDLKAAVEGLRALQDRPA